MCMKVNWMHRLKGLVWILAAMTLLANKAWAQKEPESVDKYRVVYTYKAPAVENDGVEGSAVAVRPRISPDSMGVFYDYDNSLGDLLEMHKRTNSSTVEGKGFRIQIYAGSKMEIANEAKADFLQTFRDSGMEVYKDWNAPHFWVRVGDFLSREEAMRQLSHIKTVFPDAFVVGDKINMPKYKKSMSHGG